MPKLKAASFGAAFPVESGEGASLPAPEQRAAIIRMPSPVVRRIEGNSLIIGNALSHTTPKGGIGFVHGGNLQDKGFLFWENSGL